MHYNFVVFECLVSLTIIAYTWFVLAARLRRDDYRCAIRSIRDRLFDFMWEHGYDFNNPAYRWMRRSLNGMLRMSNNLTPISYLVAFYFTLWRHQLGHLHDRITPETCPDERLRKELNSARGEAVLVTVRYLFGTGIFGLLVKTTLRLLQTVNAALRAREWGVRTAERVFELGYAFGGPIAACSKR